MFSSSSPVKIVVNRRPEMTDAEYTDQQVSLCYGGYDIYGGGGGGGGGA